MEKIRWRCKHPDPAVDYGALVDKYRAKDWLGLPTPETLKIVRTPEEVDRHELPATYVLKNTHGWNRSMLVIDGYFAGTNRSKLHDGKFAHNIRLRDLVRRWLRPDWLLLQKVHHYRQVEPGVMFETYLDPVDYELQFFLFSGICRMTMMVKRPFHHGDGIQYRIYDEHWRRLPPGRDGGGADYDHSPDETPYPGDGLFSTLADRCAHIDHVRVDCYISGGRLYFGEFTFTHASGHHSLLGEYEVTLSKFWPDVKAV